MSNDTVLARKWRPRQFSEVVGQEAVVRALSQALNSGRLHHAYLFTGTRGVGKTTLARIFSKALNCRHGLSSEPCHDDIAQAIDEGRFVDLIEIDAASKTKVEDTRELLDNVQYAPSVGRFKIYLIDEVHMLSTHSFNALLKTLEEPPAHVKFLLATTDPHKLPVTILSRCLQFHLRPMTPETLNQHLAKVLTDEGIVFESEAIALVSKMAQGSVRDALSLLDQAIILGGGQVGYDSTREMLGLASTTQILTLLQAIADQDRTSVLSQLQQWVVYGADFDRLQQQLLEQLHELAMMQVFSSLAESALVEQHSLLSKVSAEQVQIWLQVALLAKEDMQIAPSAQMGFEILLMRLLHFRATSHTNPVMNTQPKSVPVKRAAPNIQLPPQQVVAQPIPVPSAIPQPTVTIEPKSADIDLSLLLGIEVTQKKTVEISTNSIKINDNELERQFSEPSTVAPESISTSPVEPIAISKPLVVDNIQPQLEPYSAEDWKQQIVQWRLNALQLSVAERCVRLRADDPNKILLACPPSEAVSLALMRDKLAQAIHQISPNLQVSWLPTWQDHWQTIQSYAQAASEQERVMAQQQITNHPIFAQLCHSTGLTPSWDGLNKRKTSSN